MCRFGKYLIDHHQLDPQKIHLMGHSLGAHICSYIGKGIPGLNRLTAFDPAQPGFEGCPKEVRLDKSDADFVDVIHTSCRPTIPLLGFGLISPVGKCNRCIVLKELVSNYYFLFLRSRGHLHEWWLYTTRMYFTSDK